MDFFSNTFVHHIFFYWNNILKKTVTLEKGKLFFVNFSYPLKTFFSWIFCTLKTFCPPHYSRLGPWRRGASGPHPAWCAGKGPPREGGRQGPWARLDRGGKYTKFLTTIYYIMMICYYNLCICQIKFSIYLNQTKF